MIIKSLSFSVRNYRNFIYNNMNDIKATSLYVQAKLSFSKRL